MVLSNSVAFITGAARGLGRATALRLASKNARVIVCDRSENEVIETCEFIRKNHHNNNSNTSINVLPAVLDVCDPVAVETALNKAVETFGKINIIVNCAGIAPGMKTLSKKGPHDLNQFINTLNINTIGTFNVIRLAASLMANNTPNADGERGVIINTARYALSLYILNTVRIYAIYCNYMSIHVV